MRFGPLPLGRAEGAILAHSHPLPGGGRLRKGRRLAPEDLARLREAGVAEVVVAQLGPDDVHEDAAARRIAAALLDRPAPGLRAGPAGTGRVNLLSEGAGILDMRAEALHALNAVDPMITLATLPRFAPLGAGTMAATVKIISYAVPEQAVAQAEAAARGALWRAAPALDAAALIVTHPPGQEDTPGAQAGAEKGIAATRQRLATFGVRLEGVRHVAHEVGPIAEALSATLGPGGAPLALLLTATATSDPADTAPEALRRAGGAVTRFGMPVDPGNLLFLGALDARPVIGLPGCARSPALNGADWVLARVICGLPPTHGDIAAMGVGGLLKESPARPHPRAG